MRDCNNRRDAVLHACAAIGEITAALARRLPTRDGVTSGMKNHVCKRICSEIDPHQRRQTSSQLTKSNASSGESGSENTSRSSSSVRSPIVAAIDVG